MGPSRAHPSALVALAPGPRQQSRDLCSLLLECHGRIRHFCALGRQLADVPAPSAVVSDTAARVHRYFAEALPLHAADEDESVLPRLRGRSPEVDAALSRMAREHQEHQPHLDRLRVLTAQLRDEPARHHEVQAELSAVAARVERMLLDHLANEERIVIPALESHLDEAERTAIVDELALRRQAQERAASFPVE